MRPTDTVRAAAESAIATAVRRAAHVDPLADTGEWAAPIDPEERRIELVLRDGHRGQEVARLQRALRDAGFDAGPADGVYGVRTRSAVIAYQREGWIQHDAHGEAGYQTQVCLGCEILPGIDVSRWQGEIDWLSVQKSGVRWVIVKASQGGEVAERSQENLDGAAAVGLLVGAYHFGDATLSTETNAAALLESVGDRRLSLPLVLDVEQRDLHKRWGVSLGEARRRYREWAAEVGELLGMCGRRLWLYTSESMVRGPLGGGAGLSERFDLWQKQYQITVRRGRHPRYWYPDDHRGPDAPAPWSEWVAWQAGNDAVSQWGVEGVESERLDGNWLAGGALRRLGAA